MPAVTSHTSSSPHASLPDSLEERYALVCDRIGKAAKKSGRSASDIMLVAVTKFADPEQLKGLLRLGHKDFGENRVQVLQQHAAIVEEAVHRMKLMQGSSRHRPSAGQDSLFSSKVDLRPVGAAAASSAGVRWHMIGHLQRNKAKKVIDYVRLIHSVDSLRIAEELQAIAIRRDEPIEILLQVNCSGEESKFGCPIPAAIPLGEQIATMVNIRLRGLMTMAAEGARPDDARPAFERCRDLFFEMKGMRLTEDAPFNILSMGMSGDYEAAIEEGANVVRVGSAIFGTAGGTPERPGGAGDEDDDE